MAIDASIFQNYLRPVKSIQDFDNEAMAAQGNALQLQQQRMQMNALQQQQQDDQALRNYLAGGAKLDTPEGQAGLYRVAPKAAGGILKSQAEIAKENAAAGKDKALSAKASQEMIGESIKNSRMNLEGVTTPEQYIAWHEANHKDPVLGPYLESRGVTVDQARARITQALQTPGGFAQLLNESKLGAEKAYANAMQEKEFGLKQNQFGETVRHNKSTEGIQLTGIRLADSRAREATQATMSKPFEVTGADGQPVLVQQDKQGNIRPVQGYGPKPQAPNAAQQKELMSINQQRSILNGALQSVDSTPSAFSFKRGVGGKMPFGESIAGRMETPEETQARSYVFNNVSRVINERAGAAQSAQELARLNTFLPADTDNAQQIKNKINGFNQYLNDLEAGTKGNPKQPPTSGPKPGAIEDGHRFKGGDPSNPSNWEKVK